MPPADHWRSVVPSASIGRAAYHLVRAEGCYIDLQLANQEITELRAANALLQQADTITQRADQVQDQLNASNKTLSKREKRRQNWQRFGDKLTLTAITALAVAEGVYILAKELKE